MYCMQCGQELSETSKFCSSCGCPVREERKNNFVSKRQSSIDVVVDIQKKLSEIDGRKKSPIKKSDTLKTFHNVVKGKSSVLELVFEEDFEGKKIEDKKQLILEYPLPTSAKELAKFAKHINLQIEVKKKKPDALMVVWKEKLNQIYLYAKTELSNTEEFVEIQKYYKAMKRRERHESAQIPVVMLIYPIVAAFIVSIVFKWPLMMFVAILAAGWEVFFILYVYDSLDRMVVSIKQHSAKRQDVPKWLRSVAWHILIPALAALITSIAYQSVVFIVIFAVLFGVDAFFLFWFLYEVYEF